MDKRTERHAAMILAGLVANPNVMGSAYLEDINERNHVADRLVDCSIALAERLENAGKGEVG